MKAFVFPGQGSQHIGMGKDLAANFVVAKDVSQHVFDDGDGIGLANVSRFGCCQNRLIPLDARNQSLCDFLRNRHGFSLFRRS